MNAILDVVSVFTSIFNLLVDTKLFNISLFVWLITPLFIYLMVNFIKGKK